jgi:hypothetical protein
LEFKEDPGKVNSGDWNAWLSAIKNVGVLGVEQKNKLPRTPFKKMAKETTKRSN